MPLDEQSTKDTGRCQQHPNAPSVAMCDRCQRALCIRCAVPVRGRTLGSECLAAELGPNLAPAASPLPRRAPLRWTGAGLSLALLATVLPWKRFGLGSGPFGAWGLTPRWSLLAATAALIGTLLWAGVAFGRFQPSRRWVLCLRVCAIGVIAGAALHLVRPPGFGPASFGPWVSLATGVLALSSSFFAIPHPAVAPESPLPTAKPKDASAIEHTLPPT